MFSNNQYSSILLLAVLAFLIYYLSQPVEGNSKKLEKVEDVNASSKEEQVKNNEQEAEKPVEAVKTVEVASTQNMEVAGVVAPVVAQAPKQSAEPMPAPVPAPTPVQAVDVSKLVEEVVREVPLKQQKQVKFSQDIDGYGAGFEAADLDAAFLGAVPPDASIDKVDFNRGKQQDLDVKQFLPREVNDTWFETDFASAKNTVEDDKMIPTERYIIGINTVGQSLKNPTYDLRGTIPNPKFTVSPWNNSTYEPDTNLKPLY
jgi:hypothetical protein